jgi:hypothetical protein
MKYLLILLFSVNTYANECPKLDTLNAGDKAPCVGFFVSQPTMNQIAKDKEELVLVRQQVLTLKELRAVDSDILKVEKDRLQTANNELKKEQFKGNAKSIGAFVLGVLATSLAAYAAIQASK